MSYAMESRHPRWSGDSPSHRAMHRRLERRRGKASTHACINCGKPANEWSFVHDTNPSDIASYVPRCWSCHRKYDGQEPPHTNKLLTTEDVDEIISLREAGLTVSEISRELGVRPPTVYARCRQRRKELSR